MFWSFIIKQKKNIQSVGRAYSNIIDHASPRSVLSERKC
jgi:hypothetical protein